MKNILDRLKMQNSVKSTDNGRRDFIKQASMGGLALGFLFDKNPAKEIDFITQKVKRFGAPSELKITDIRVAVVTGAPMVCPILRIDTNQGITGYGEIRDGASAKYGLFLKSRLLGKNPCHVEQIFKSIKQFGGQGRAAGGVCGVEQREGDPGDLAGLLGRGCCAEGERKEGDGADGVGRSVSDRARKGKRG